MAEPRLRIGQGLTFPVDAITQTFVIFGKRGSGKSNTAVVMAEEMHRVGAPFVVLDPVSAWWGLKSSFDGAGEGLPVYVFGGPPATRDLPLEPTSGELMAQLFIEHRIPMILDMKGWTGGERARFVTAFAVYLLGHNDRVPAHVFLEEADAFIPQRPYKGEEPMLGAMDRLIRWGRQEGLGATAVTQRSAKINKDVTTQAETLIAHRTTGPQDREAIDGWIRYHAGGDERQQLLSSLPTLPDGTAWVWSPEWLEIFRQVVVRRRETYDSASTPKIGEKRMIQPKALAEVDLDRLRDRMAATIERAEAEDPKKLQARIRQLEREAAKRPAERVVETVTETVEVPVLNGQVDELAEVVQKLVVVGQGLSKTAEHLGGIGRDIITVGDRITAAVDRVSHAKRAPLPAPRAMQAAVPPSRPIRLPAPTPAVRPVSEAPIAEGDVKLGKAERTLLAAIVQYPAGLTVRQLSLLTGYSYRSGHFANVLGTLRSAGLIEPGQPLSATDAGRGHPHIADVAPLPQPGPELIDYWFRRLGRAERAILEVFIADYPADVGREDLGERTGYSPQSGHFANVLGRLRTLGLIEGWRASEDLVG